VEAGDLFQGGVVANFNVNASFVAQTVAGILSSRLGLMPFYGPPRPYGQSGNYCLRGQAGGGGSGGSIHVYIDCLMLLLWIEN
jgi:hypothetical protein